MCIFFMLLLFLHAFLFVGRKKLVGFFVTGAVALLTSTSADCEFEERKKDKAGEKGARRQVERARHIGTHSTSVRDFLSSLKYIYTTYVYTFIRNTQI